MSNAYYRPQRSCEGYVFTGVCLSTGGRGCLPQCMVGYTPQSRHPPGSRHPPRADTPQSRHPPEQTPPEQTPPEQTPWADTPQEQTPPRADTPLEQTPPGSRPPPPRDGHCCGRYASYWNAFLFCEMYFEAVKKKFRQNRQTNIVTHETFVLCQDTCLKWKGTEMV